jgi:hypothetical protein
MQSLELLGRGISPSKGLNKHKRTSIFGVGLEPTNPAFDGAKVVHSLDLVHTVISSVNITDL